MEKKLTTQINKLIVKLKNKEVPLNKAIEEYCQLISKFHNTARYSINSTIEMEEISDFGKILLEENILVEQRIQKLERILLLQELGVKFTKDELKGVLGN